MRISRIASSEPNIACRPASFSTTRPMVDCTPKSALHSTQAAGASSRSTRCDSAASDRSSRGASVMASSGRRSAQSPHCRQASSENRSRGVSGLSSGAPDGQSDARARHSVQASETSAAPQGAPSDGGIGSAPGRSAFAAARVTCRRVPMEGIGSTGADVSARRAAGRSSGSVGSGTRIRPGPAIASASARSRSNVPRSEVGEHSHREAAERAAGAAEPPHRHGEAVDERGLAHHRPAAP